jgi:guanine deaminase
LFREADRRGVRAVIGKVSMDREAPATLLSHAQEDAEANERLIADWHGRNGRLFVALTPRFALSCTPELMRSLGELRARHPDLYVQTHHAETRREIEAVCAAFPDAPHYLGVYERFGLVGARTVLGHTVHPTDAELERIAALDAAVAHCPTSNVFLGSGLFPLARVAGRGIRIGLGSDVGAGTSFSAWRTMGAGYAVQKLREEPTTPVRLFRLATLGGAEALHLEHRIGNFEPGKCADFVVLDWRRSRLLAERWRRGDEAADRLAALIALGDDRLTEAVYVDGLAVFDKAGSPS